MTKTVWTVFLSLFALTGWSQTGKYALQQHAALPNNYFLTKLPNQLTVLAVEDPATPTAELSLFTQGGAAAQMGAFQGAPAAMKFMFFQPNAKQPDRNEFAQLALQHGMRLDAQTAEDYCRYSVYLPTVYAPQAAALLYHAARYPKFDSLELIKTRFQLARNFQLADENPSHQLTQAVAKALLGADAPRMNPESDYDAVKKLSLDALRNYARQYLQPGAMLLVINSNLKYPRAFALADSVFGGWKSQAAPLAKPKPFFELTEDTSFVLLNENIKNPVAQMAWVLPPFFQNPMEHYTALVVKELLTNPNGLFHKKLFQTKRALNLSARYQPAAAKSMFTLTLLCENAQVSATIDTLLLQIKKWGKYQYFTQNEMNRARNAIEYDYLFRQENQKNLPSETPLLWLRNDWRGAAGFLDSIKQVTIIDVKRFIEKYLEENPSAIGLLVNSKQLAANRLEEYLQKRFRSRKPPVVVKPEWADVASLPRSPLVAQATAQQPALAPQSTAKDWLNYQVHFTLNSAELDSVSYQTVQTVASFLQQFPETKIWVNGHTDSKGDPAFNEQLSLERAQMVAKILSEKFRIAPQRLKVRGLGSSQLMFPDDDGENSARNRRVDFSLWSNPAAKP